MAPQSPFSACWAAVLPACCCPMRENVLPPKPLPSGGQSESGLRLFGATLLWGTAMPAESWMLKRRLCYFREHGTIVTLSPSPVTGVSFYHHLFGNSWRYGL